MDYLQNYEKKKVYDHSNDCWNHKNEENIYNIFKKNEIQIKKTYFFRRYYLCHLYRYYRNVDQIIKGTNLLNKMEENFEKIRIFSYDYYYYYQEDQNMNHGTVADCHHNLHIQIMYQFGK